MLVLVKCHTAMRVKRAVNGYLRSTTVALVSGCLIFGSSSVTHAQQTPQVLTGPPVVYKPLELRRVILHGRPFVQIKVSSERIGLHASSHGALFYRLRIGDVVVGDIGTSGVYSSSLIFTLRMDEFASLKNDQIVSVLYGDGVVYTFCCLNKKSIRRTRPF